MKTIIYLVYETCNNPSNFVNVDASCALCHLKASMIANEHLEAVGPQEV